MDTSGLLDETLKKCLATRFTGVVRVAGEPGGTIHLVAGGIAACETPDAPSLEVVLLRSGAVSEQDWDEAFAASAMAGRPMTAELTRRELLGVGELEALLRITLADSMFALVNGTIEACDTEEGSAEFLLPLDPAAKPGWLLAEAMRRVQVLASFPEPAVGARDRVTAATRGAADILALADGRRTVRDLAFVLGHGLYATLLLLNRMRAEDLVVVTASRGEPSAPRESATALPRRRKDRVPASRQEISAMLRPRAKRTTKPDR